MSLHEGLGTAVNILIGKHCYGKNLKQQKATRPVQFITAENNPTAFSHNTAYLIRKSKTFWKTHHWMNVRFVNRHKAAT